MENSILGAYTETDCCTNNRFPSKQAEKRNIVPAIYHDRKEIVQPKQLFFSVFMESMEPKELMSWK